MSRHIKLTEAEYQELTLILRSIASSFDDLSCDFWSFKKKVDNAICYEKPKQSPTKELNLSSREIDDRYAAAVARLWVGDIE